MAARRKVKIKEIYQINWFTNLPVLDWQMARMMSAVNVITLISFGVYFFGALNMTDKMFTFMISGKLIGTSYTLEFNEICWMAAGLVALLLTRSTYGYLKVAKNRNKIRLQITEAYPTSLKVRITV